MNPPKPGGAFHDDLLPFGFIEVDGRVPYDRTIVRSNWNSELTSAKLRERSAKAHLPMATLLALGGFAAAIWARRRRARASRGSRVAGLS